MDRYETHEKVEHRPEPRSEMTQHVEQAYSHEALASLRADKVSQFADRKIDKIEEIDGKPVTPKEREAMKDIAEAVAKGNMGALRKTIDALDEKTARRVAHGLHDALHGTGIDFKYDVGLSGNKEFPTIQIIAGDVNVMIPLDGGTPQVGDKDDSYGRPQRVRDEGHTSTGERYSREPFRPSGGRDATAEDLKDARKALRDAQAKERNKSERYLQF